MPDADADCGKNSDVIGKGGAAYRKHGAFCLETQKHADAIHHVNTHKSRWKSIEGRMMFSYFSDQLSINHFESGKNLPKRDHL